MKPVGKIFRTLLLPVLLWGITCRHAAGQQPDKNRWVQDKTISGPFSDFEIDNLGNLYLIGQQQQLKKLSPALDSIAVFNDKRNYGRLFAADVSNPLKTLLFYKDFGVVVVLDRFLNTRSVINLRRAGLQQVAAIAQSYDNNIWLYDELENQIRKMDENGKMLTSTPDFRVLFEEPPQPQVMHDYNRYLYVYDSARGLMVLDYFGALKNKYSFTGWQHVHTAAKGIVASRDTSLLYFETGTLDLRTIPLPLTPGHIQKLRLYNAFLWILDNRGNMVRYRLEE